MDQSFTREAYAAIAFVRDESLLYESANHSAHRRRRDTQFLGDAVRFGHAELRLELEDHLEVVLDRTAERRRCPDRRHASVPRGVFRRSPRTRSTGTRDRWRTSFATLP